MTVVAGAADGWVPWTESDSGALTPPDLGDLAIGETIESRYEYDRDRLIIKAWQRTADPGRIGRGWF